MQSQISLSHYLRFRFSIDIREGVLFAIVLMLEHKFMAAVTAKLMELYFAFFGGKKMVIKNISI